MPTPYKVEIDSCLLPNRTRFGTINLLDITREEYKGDEIVWAEMLFSIPSPKWFWDWLVKSGRRIGCTSDGKRYPRG